MPLGSEYRKQMDSELADIKNVGGRQGGACVAASFLKEFVTVDRWIHLDIAGTALPGSRDSSYIPSGMTGAPTRALIQFVRNLVKK
jgi:leucyl aminopeptidase